jgi:hypothetical protein
MDLDIWSEMRTKVARAATEPPRTAVSPGTETGGCGMRSLIYGLIFALGGLSLASVVTSETLIAAGLM